LVEHFLVEIGNQKWILEQNAIAFVGGGFLRLGSR